MQEFGVHCVRRAVSGAGLTDFGKAACVSLLLVLSCALSPAFAQAFEGDGCTPEMKVKEGSGSEAVPYEIRTLCQLQDISSNPKKHYVLMDNVDASATKDWNGGAGFRPIPSTMTDKFSGSFVSTGKHVIRSLTINSSSTNYVGLFSRLAINGKIEGIRLVGSRTTGLNFTGSLVGDNKGVIENSYVMAGSVFSESEVGGLVGRNRGNIRDSYASGSVSGFSGVGGLAGYNLGRISGSSATGSVTGRDRQVGGLVGFLNFDSVIIDSYATGSVSGDEEVGGLVGGNSGDISDSYASGSVSGRQENDAVGGLVGYNLGRISGSSATGSVSGGRRQVGGLVGFLNFGSDISDSHATGSVSGAENVGGFVGSLDSKASITGNYATGSVVGTGNNIGGLVGGSSGNISDSYATGLVSGSTSVGGLVGSSDSGSINNSHATGSVSGAENVGGFVGSLDSKASITGNYATGSVVGTGNNIGGLVGGSSGDIRVSYATGLVSGDNQVGGLVGSQAIGSSISVSYATGSVSGDNQVGGLVGGSSGDISNSYATGLVSGDNQAGGLVGLNQGSISGSSATGSVYGQQGVGGLIGENNAAISVSFATSLVSGDNHVSAIIGLPRISVSYATGSVSGTENVGGLVGLNQGDIRDSYATGFVSGRGDNVGGLVGFQATGSLISFSYATGSVSGNNPVGGLVGSAIDNGRISKSYYAARGQKNDLGTERTFTQLRCPTKSSATCSLSGSDQRTYEDWDTSVWGFGSAMDLPQLLSNRNSELNLKPYINGSADLVVVTGFTGITQLPLVADYLGPSEEFVILTWSLSGVPTPLRHLVYFDLGGGTTSTTFTDSRKRTDGASMAMLVVVGNE